MNHHRFRFQRPGSLRTNAARILLVAAVTMTTPLLGFAQSVRDSRGKTWHQPAGPHGNWKVEGTPPIEWSVVRDENILWRTSMPECGESNVTIWADRAFTTIHKPLKSIDEKNRAKDIVGYCLNADDGTVLWTVDLPGSAPISINGGFSDGTVFGPITDGKYVWFFNRCGSMGCYDFEGKQIWFREFTPRYKHNNRQFEPLLVGDALLNVEVLNKELGSKIQKWKPDGVTKNKIEVPTDPEQQKQVWCYIHGIDKNTGKTRWREPLGTSIHTTATLGTMQDGTPALVYARGGFHGTLEHPYGLGLMSLANGHEGESLWTAQIKDFASPSYNMHWNKDYVVGFTRQGQFVLNTNTGKLLRHQPLYEDYDFWKYDPDSADWKHHPHAKLPYGKSIPCTYQSNILVGDWHYFRAHRLPYLVRANVETGKVEALELPSQIRASKDGDELLWGSGLKNVPVNAQGFAVGNKGHNGIGWGHLSAASPTLVGKHLFIPLVTGTVCVIDTSAKHLNGDALVAVNDLGASGRTGTWASISYANGRLYARTMRDIVCIGLSIK